MIGQLVVTVTTTLCLGLASEGLLHASDTVRVTRLFTHVGLLAVAFPLPTPHAHPPSLGHYFRYCASLLHLLPYVLGVNVWFLIRRLHMCTGPPVW